MLASIVAGAAVLWAAALPAATYLATLSSGAAQLLAVAVYGLGSVICHQRADRSFHLFAEQLPVCARCTGLYAGAALIAIAQLWGMRLRRPAADLTPAARRLLAITALPMAASIVYEWTTGDVPSNLARAATGVVLGAGVAYVILAAVDSTR